MRQCHAVWVLQPRHVLANEYQSFLAEMQHSDVRQLFSGAKARLQRTGHSHPAHKAFLSQISDFVELARSVPSIILSEAQFTVSFWGAP